MDLSVIIWFMIGYAIGFSLVSFVFVPLFFKWMDRRQHKRMMIEQQPAWDRYEAGKKEETAYWDWVKHGEDK